MRLTTDAPSPRPNPNVTRAQKEQRAAQQSVRLTALRRWQIWLVLNIVLFVVMFLDINGGR